MLSSIRSFLSRATPAQRVVLGIFLNVPFLFAFMAAQSVGLFVEEWRALLNPKYIILGNYIIGSTVLVQFILLWRLWPARHSEKEIPRTFTLLAFMVGIALTYEAFLWGNLTFPTNMVIIAIVPIGLLILDLKSVAIPIAIAAVAIVLNDILIHAEIIPYAPGYMPEAFESGQHHLIAELFRSGIQYISLVTYGALTWVLFDQYDDQRQKLILTSRLDPLTGIANRRHFMNRLEEECGRQNRTRQPLCLAMIDADHFKQINDSYGHIMGDEVLRGIAAALSEQMRVPEDLPARIGGEEFAILFTDTNLEGAEKVCRRIQDELKQLNFVAAGKRFGITLSIGLVESKDLNHEAFMHYADANMYKAKAQGRNTMVSSQETRGENHERMASLG